jgi:hypothetical protein
VALVSVATWAQGLRRFLRISGGESFLELLDHIQPSIGLGQLPPELLAAFGFVPFHWSGVAAAGAAGTFAQSQLVNPTGSRILAVVSDWSNPSGVSQVIIGIAPQLGAAVPGFGAGANIFNTDSRQAKTAGGTSGTGLLVFTGAQAASGATSEIATLATPQYTRAPILVMGPGSSAFFRVGVAATAMTPASASGYYRQFEDTELNV